MKKIVKYRCGVCWKEFNTEEEALHCEKTCKDLNHHPGWKAENLDIKVKLCRK